ncbi:MAG TPA: 3-keto-5-aminohexanoate cleavage protein [Ramlibacter sp.]|nr:3-keto-5-aminohexanoate cleavage protein [Ramlibacter sp.]
MHKLIIQVRLNESTKRDVSPHVPYSPTEIADQAIECWRAGASIVHYHARDPVTGAKASDVDLHADVVRRIKKECDLITFPTLGAALLPDPADRMSHIVEMAANPATHPDLIPVDMLSSNMDWYDAQRRQFIGSGDQVYLNTTNTLRYLCENARAVGVKPVSMLWNVASIRLTEAFIDLGIYDTPLLCELPLFGDHMRAYGTPATIKGLYSLYEFMPRDQKWNWMANALGVNAFPVIAAAIELGGHAVIGVADYPYRELGYPTNAQLVANVAEMARYMGREVATPAEAREMLGLGSHHGT